MDLLITCFFSPQAAVYLEVVRSLLKLAIVFFVHAIYPQVVVEEVLLVEDEEDEEVDFNDFSDYDTYTVLIHATLFVP